MRRTGYLHRPPTSMYPTDILHAESCPESAYIYFKFHKNQLSGLGAVEGRKSTSPIDKAYRLYNSLYYRTSRDVTAVCM